ncbi:hypothetical protein [Stenotrophomonas sp. PD6]|uniref:hypothetical protein n=1 Tax=Stenotrophomonas sp. PD6 TaxID=3368612 RepID=UPI003B9EBE5E
MIKLSLRLLPLLLATAFTPAPAVAASTHVDLVDFPTVQANWDRFHDLARRLAVGFDNVCADTFCEGEFSDIEAFRLRCAVERATGSVSECRWAFAASEVEVDEQTGRIVARQPTWLCRLPIPAGTSVETLFNALAGPNAIFARLPGAGTSVYEAVGDCLTLHQSPS